jgi:Replication factor A protein 3
MSMPTPRILPTHLHAFHPSNPNSRTVHAIRLLGTVTALRGDTATLSCGNHGDVTLLLKADSNLRMGRLVEVVGKVIDLDGGQVRSTKFNLYYVSSRDSLLQEVDALGEGTMVFKIGRIDVK